LQLFTEKYDLTYNFDESNFLNETILIPKRHYENPPYPSIEVQIINKNNGRYIGGKTDLLTMKKLINIKSRKLLGGKDVKDPEITKSE